MLEVLVALAILAIAAATLAAANGANVRKTERARILSHRSFLIREKLAELLLAPPPIAEEDSGWTPFTDAAGLPIEPDLVWRKVVAEAPFLDPATGSPSGGRSLWSITLVVAPAVDPDGDQGLSVVAWAEPPPPDE